MSTTTIDAMITVEVLRAAACHAHDAMCRNEQRLNEADGKLGDGDTGSMLARLTEALAGTDIAQAEDLGAAFALYARAGSAATGSSLGTLLVTALLAASKATKGKPAIGWNELSPLVGAALEAMMRRGGASLGDKTILDAVHAVAEALREVSDEATARRLAAEAARRTLDDFRDKPNRIGRARMFAERSIGQDDPGMLALCILLSDGP